MSTNTSTVNESSSLIDGEIRLRRRWLDSETISYLKFVGCHQEKLSAQRKAQKQRIYNEMSAAVGSRDPAQCKSHHQKLMKKYSTIEKILQQLPKNIGKKSKRAK